LTAVQDGGSSSFDASWLRRLGAQSMGEVLTFYSYKGGTGRSMALVNCAGLIAQQLPSAAKPILLVDFDLEAPGLHRYLAPFLADVRPNTWGVLELFAVLEKAVDRMLATAPTEKGTTSERVADEDVAHIVDELDLAPFIEDTRLGTLKLMPAGVFDDTYHLRLSRFDWEELHRKAPALFRCLAGRLARDYSLTFVDSRTGLSDTSGICTMLLPDVLVMVFTPNQQSLTGIEHLVRKAVSYRSEAAESRVLRVYPLPSRVDNQVEHFRHVWRHGAAKHELFGDVIGYQPIFAEIFGSSLGMAGDDAMARLSEYFDVVQVPYSADYSYGERLCFASNAASDSLSMRVAYEQFLLWLVTAAEPWQRPADRLLDQQAAAWLHEAGVDQSVREGVWGPWFDRVAAAAETEPAAGLVKLASAPARRFDVCLALALGMAWREQLVESSIWLESASSAFDDALEVALPDAAPAALLELWLNHKTPATLNSPERRGWCGKFEAVLRQSQGLKGQRLRWLSALGAFAQKLGWLEDELRLHIELVQVAEATLGLEHEQTLDATTRLARSHYATGDYEMARMLEEQVVEHRRRLDGEEAPATLVAIDNLAHTLYAQGSIAEAFELQQSVVAAMQRVLGRENPDTLRAQLRLAGTLFSRGDLASAHENEAIVLEARRRLLGDEHRDTLTARLNFAQTLKTQGDIAGARSHMEDVFHAMRRLLGDEHPDTLWARMELGSTLYFLGDLAGARLHEEAVVQGMSRCLGNEHPATLKARNNLAGTLKAQGAIEGARSQMQEVFETSRRVLGDEHPGTLTARLNLAGALYELGDLDGARVHEEAVVRARQRALGDEHLATLTAKNNLAQTLKGQGDLEGAHALELAVFEARVRQLGKGHPFTLSTMQNLVLTLRAMSRPQEAIALQEELLATTRESGDSSEATLRAMQGLATLLLEGHEFERGFVLYKDTFERSYKTLGPRDDLTVSCSVALGAILLEGGQAKAAADVLDSVEATREGTQSERWLTLRLRVAERLGDQEGIQRLRRLQYGAVRRRDREVSE
jgi:cellulose biosynthesis protein BcsQ/uncharacterized protein (DUF2267 family)